MVNNETPEDRTARYLKRSTFDEVDSMCRKNQQVSRIGLQPYEEALAEMKEIVRLHGWTEEEFMKEFYERNPPIDS